MQRRLHQSSSGQEDVSLTLRRNAVPTHTVQNEHPLRTKNLWSSSRARTIALPRLNSVSTECLVLEYRSTNESEMLNRFATSAGYINVVYGYGNALANEECIRL